MLRSIYFLIAFLTIAPSRGDEPPAAQEPPSLDSQLLENLDSELLEGLSPPADPAQPAGESPNVIGEDIGAGDTAADDDNPLTRIEQKMRQVEHRLSQRDSSPGTQNLQREIADELAALLEQLQQQQQQQQQQNQSNQNSQQQQQQQDQSASKKKEEQKKSSKLNSSNQPAQKPARDSEERNAKTEEKIKPEDLQELFQRAWGNLPPQVRQRMDAAAQEQFLPKYQTLIEDYFRRLAEESR